MYTLNQIVRKYSPQDVRSFIDDFMNQNNPRYDSFDYCYGFFQTNQRNLTNNMEQSCMALWSYLASWGMLRGSSMLLRKGNYKALEDTITVIQRYFNNPQSLPNIDNDSQNDYVMKVVNLCGDIKNSFTQNRMQPYHSTNTLITKIVLGVFGVFPALDQYFCKTFGGGTSIRGFAGVVWDFDKHYQGVLQSVNIQVKSFNGQITRLNYPIAKLIDMFGFTYGMYM